MSGVDISRFAVYGMAKKVIFQQKYYYHDQDSDTFNFLNWLHKFG